MASVNDQFKMGRIPIRIISYNQKDLAECRELLIDYDGENPTYNIYLVDKEDRTKLINLTDEIINQAFPSINADNLRITINGLLNSVTLKEVMNDIYHKFVFPENAGGFDYTRDYDKLYDESTMTILLTDKSGQIYLPVTTADNVYDSSGQSIQARLDSMTRLGFSSGYVRAETVNQTSFKIDYPFKNYSLQGNYMELRIGTTFIDKSRYEIVDNEDANNDIVSATITLLDEQLEKGRAINVLFIYNSITATGGELQAMSGAQIANGSIPTAKMEKVSDAYYVPDSSSIASSRALYNLYNEMMNIIDNYSPYSIYAVDANKSLSAGSILIVNNSEFILRDSSQVNVRITTKTKAGATLQLNGKSYPIYDNGDPIPYSVDVDRVMRLTFSVADQRFYVTSMYQYRIAQNRFMYTAKDKELTISFKGLYYNYGDPIMVYRNGVRLFEFVDYSIDYSTETIKIYVMTEAGERFVFESLSVERK